MEVNDLEKSLEQLLTYQRPFTARQTPTRPSIVDADRFYSLWTTST